MNKKATPIRAKSQQKSLNLRSKLLFDSVLIETRERELTRFITKGKLSDFLFSFLLKHVVNHDYSRTF
jgi:hypothetical protein